LARVFLASDALGVHWRNRLVTSLRELNIEHGGSSIPFGATAALTVDVVEEAHSRDSDEWPCLALGEFRDP